MRETSSAIGAPAGIHSWKGSYKQDSIESVVELICVESIVEEEQDGNCRKYMHLLDGKVREASSAKGALPGSQS